MFQLWFGGFSREVGDGGRRQPSRRRNHSSSDMVAFLTLLWTKSANTTELREDNLCNFSVQCVCLIVQMLMYECEVLLQIGSQAMQV